MDTKLKKTAVAAIAVIVAAACFLIIRPGYYLTLTNRDTGKVYEKYPMKEGDCFSITFIHSVNKTPVTDYFYIEDGHIFNEECKYYGFGAGVQTQLNEGESLSYTEDGGMLISNIHQNRDNVGYIVGTVSDHVLNVNGKDVSLRDMCGRNTPVRFNYIFTTKLH